MISLDQLVPEDHLLRKIDKYVDFNFIYDLVEEKCSMKVRCICDTLSTYMLEGKVYNVIAKKGNWYRMVDETGEDTLYPVRGFEIVEE